MSTLEERCGERDGNFVNVCVNGMQDHTPAFRKLRRDLSRGGSGSDGPRAAAPRTQRGPTWAARASLASRGFPPSGSSIDGRSGLSWHRTRSPNPRARRDRATPDRRLMRAALLLVLVPASAGLAFSPAAVRGRPSIRHRHALAPTLPRHVAPTAVVAVRPPPRRARIAICGGVNVAV